MKKITIRLDDELHARIEKITAREKRSLNGQIAWLLQTAVSLEETRFLLEEAGVPEFKMYREKEQS